MTVNHPFRSFQSEGRHTPRQSVLLFVIVDFMTRVMFQRVFVFGTSLYWEIKPKLKSQIIGRIQETSVRFKRDLNSQMPLYVEKEYFI